MPKFVVKEKAETEPPVSVIAQEGLVAVEEDVLQDVGDSQEKPESLVSGDVTEAQGDLNVQTDVEDSKEVENLLVFVVATGHLVVFVAEDSEEEEEACV